MSPFSLSSASALCPALQKETKPATTRVNGGKEWQRSNILDGLEVDIDKAERKYGKDAVKVICGILEKEFGTGLNVARSGCVYANGRQLRIEYRCKAYYFEPDDSDESDTTPERRCPFHVKVTTMLEDGEAGVLWYMHIIRTS